MFSQAMFLALAMFHLDAAHSTAGFTIKHFLVGSTHGTMKIVSADVSLQPNSTVPSSVDAVIDVASVSTSEKGRDDDLRSAEWFDVARFPTMHYASTRVEPAKSPNAFRVIGTLPMHGTTKDVPLDVTVNDAGGRQLHYVATATFDRRDFGVDAPGKTMRGNLLVGTSVTVRIDLTMNETEG